MAEERISISRDALRAELAQLELRLVQSLASKAELDRLTTRVENLEERSVKRDGPLIDEFRRFENDVVKLKDSALTEQDVNETIAEALHNQNARGWTSRERFIGLLLAGITAATFLLNLIERV